jgi:hypothetical protein
LQQALIANRGAVITSISDLHSDLIHRRKVSPPLHKSIIATASVMASLASVWRLVMGMRRQAGIRFKATESGFEAHPFLLASAKRAEIVMPVFGAGREIDLRRPNGHKLLKSKRKGG